MRWRATLKGSAASERQHGVRPWQLDAAASVRLANRVTAASGRPIDFRLTVSSSGVYICLLRPGESGGMVDALVLGTSGFGRGGSNPPFRMGAAQWGGGGGTRPRYAVADLRW